MPDFLHLSQPQIARPYRNRAQDVLLALLHNRSYCSLAGPALLTVFLQPLLDILLPFWLYLDHGKLRYSLCIYET